MARDETRCREDELQILVNILGPSITLSYPLYGFPLLTVRASGEQYRFSLQSTREQLDAAKETFGETTRKELPDFDDLFSCLLNAGIVQYTNWEEFQEWVKAFTGMKKGILFGLDTNLFYHGMPLLSGIDPSRFLVVDITKEEIEASLNTKLNPQQITEMKREVPYQRQMLDELVNQRTKRARLATYLALRQY
ncbi:MAG: hypothetical protein LUO93_03065, partial [Methanomicrobiales archaeon]|nr:hypothetical protein [Methanomicrobiales archaeon]